MVDKDPIVISDSDSDTLSESERPTQQQQKAVSAKTKAILQPEAPATRTSTSSDTLTEPPSRDDTSRPTPDAGSSSTASSLLSLLPDRRQLELERQERARKRRREQGLLSESSDEGEGKEAGSKRIGIGSGYIDPRQPQQASSSLSSAIQQDVKLTAPHASSSKHTLDGSPSPKFSRARDPIHPSSRFFDGTIKHGYNRYSSSGVSIPQMLLPATASSRNGLQLAVLATYDLRLDWLYSLFPRGLPVTLVLPPPKEDYRTDPAIARPGLHRSEIFGGDFARCPGWQICVPHKPKGGWLTQHMKFLLLVHEGWMRVAILSGNLNEIDWERIENTAYIQDFPLLPSATAGKSSDRAEGNDFKNQLIRVLRSLSMPPSHPIFAAMEKHDFSKATRARIVASWPEASSLEGWDRIETQGLGRLGKVVRELGVGASVELECQGSSLANHDVKWIEHFHLLASGVSPRGLLPLKGKPNERHAEYFRATGRKVGSLPPVKICFPSQRYVEQDTVEGGMGALSFFGKAETFGKSPIKSLYHTPQSRRGDIMIHAKSILALTAEGKDLVDKAFREATQAQESGRPPAVKSGEWTRREGEKPVGWTYLGSSNFTRAAHGNVSGTTGKPTMSSLNWELGVVLPIYASEVEHYGVEAESLRPVVYHRPLQAYASSDTPWDNTTALALL